MKSIEDIIEDQAEFGARKFIILKSVEMSEKTLKIFSESFYPKETSAKPQMLVKYCTVAGYTDLVVNKNLRDDVLLFNFVKEINY